MTPLARQRIQHFKTNKRGFYSLIVFAILFTVTLFAEFIANDKPLLISYEGKFYTPLFKVYPETEFGGDFETETVYKDPYVQQLIQEKGGWMAWPLIRYSYNTINYDLPSPAPSAPTSEIGSAPMIRAGTSWHVLFTVFAFLSFLALS